MCFAEEEIPEPKFASFDLEVLDYRNDRFPSLWTGRELSVCDGCSWDTFLLFRFIIERLVSKVLGETILVRK